MRKWRGLDPLEKQVEAECDRMMALLHWTAIRFSQARATRQTRGIPDRKYYKGGWTFWFECKAEGGKQGPDQRAFQEMCQQAGEFYVVGGVRELAFFLLDVYGEKVKASA